VKNEIFFTKITDHIQARLKKTVAVKTDFLDQSINNFRDRFERLVVGEARRPEEIWEALSEVLTHLHDRLNDSFELESLLGHESFMEQWRDPYLSEIQESKTLISEFYEDSFWRLKSSVTPGEKTEKILHYLIHPIFFLRSRGRIPWAGKKPVRTFNPRLLNELLILKPVFEFQWQELHQLLLFYSRFLVDLQSATDRLKDNILQTATPQTDETYWGSLQEVNNDKMIQQFENGIDKTKEAIRGYKTEAENRLSNFVEELTGNYAHQWYIAGTTLLPGRKYSARRLSRWWLKQEKQLSLFKAGWISHLESVKDEWQKDLELGSLQLKIASLHNETGELINQKSEVKIQPALNQLMQRLTSARKEIDALPESSGKELYEKLLLFNRTLQKGIRQNELANAVEALTNAHISRTFRGFVSRVADLAENLTERHIIIKAYNTDKFPPKTTVDEVMLKEIVQEEIVFRAQRENEEQISQLAVNLDSITRTISTLDQVIDFNFNAAIDLVRQGDDKSQNDKAVQIVTEGIDRTIGLLQDAQNRYQSTIKDGIERIDLLAFNLEKGVQELSDNEKILQLKLRLARVRTRENLRNWRSDLWQAIKKFLPNILRILRNYIGQVGRGYRKVRKISGLSSDIDGIRPDISGYLRSEEQKIARLPFIYQRLFEILPLDDERFFFGRSQEMDKIKEHFEGFKNGQIEITAIIGEKGGGKTTLLNFARKSIFKGFTISRTAIPYTIWDISEFCKFIKTELAFECNDSPDEIEQFLLKGPKRILILEDVHNLFLRKIDGFEVIEALLKLISATQEQVYWILTSGLYGWKFLDYVLHISDFFTEVIELDNLDLEEVEQLIMSRHNMSGFRLEFTAPDEVEGIRSFRKLKTADEKQDFLRRRFFEHLSEVSGGNVKTSMIYWISSLQFSKPDEPIQVLDNLIIDQSFIYQITSEDLYYLAAYIQHEYLTVQEFALIFGVTLSQAKFILNRMARKGYMKMDKHNYYIPALLYRPIVYMLKVRNIIY